MTGGWVARGWASTLSCRNRPTKASACIAMPPYGGGFGPTIKTRPTLTVVEDIVSTILSVRRRYFCNNSLATTETLKGSKVASKNHADRTDVSSKGRQSSLD